jgi:hypothetical protein
LLKHATFNILNLSFIRRYFSLGDKIAQFGHGVRFDANHGRIDSLLLPIQFEGIEGKIERQYTSLTSQDTIPEPWDSRFQFPRIKISCQQVHLREFTRKFPFWEDLYAYVQRWEIDLRRCLIPISGVLSQKLRSIRNYIWYSKLLFLFGV